jgi:hypothetical protein
MANQTTFSLPRERGEQLRKLALHHRLNISDLIGVWIDKALAEAGLSEAVPGVQFSFTSRDEANEAAETIERVTDGGMTATMTLIGADWFKVERHGSGITLSDDRTKTRQSYALNVARSIARQLRYAAQAATQTVEQMLGDLEATESDA